MRNRERVPHLARRLRYGDIDRPETVTIPGGEYEILEYRRIVVLLRHAPPRLAARFRRRLIEAFVELIIGNGKAPIMIGVASASTDSIRA